MLQTLIEIARTHSFPFIAEHHYNAQRWLVLGYFEGSEVVFDVRKLERGEDTPRVGEPIGNVYGGYQMWRFEKEMDKRKTISAEEQRKLREEQRRLDNEKTKRAYRLKPGDSIRSRSTTAAPAPSKKEEGNVVHVDFTKKNKF